MTDPVITRHLTDLMIRGCLRIRPKALVPRTEQQKLAWDVWFDKIIRLDGRGVSDLRDMIVWIYTENQKRGDHAYVVMAPKTLRLKYDTIAIGINAERGPARRRAAEQKRDEEAHRIRREERQQPNSQVASIVTSISDHMRTGDTK